MEKKKEKKKKKEKNEISYLYEWMSESVQKDGFAATLELIKSKRKIGPHSITKPIRNILISYFKVLLDTPFDIPSLPPYNKNDRFQKINR